MEKNGPVFRHGQARLVALATLLVLVAPVCAQDAAKVEIAPMLGHSGFDASLQLWSTTMSMAFEKEAAQPMAGLFMAMEYALGLSEEARRKIPVSMRKDTTPRIYAPIGTLHGQFHAASTPPDTATDCDRLASHPNDPLRVVSDGIPIDKLDADAALAACSQAISNAPSEGRYYFNRARALAKIADAARKAKNEPRMSLVYEALAKIADAARKANEARISSLYEAEIADFKAGMERGYPMAFNNMALAYFFGAGVEKNPDKAADLKLEAANRVLYCCWTPVARRILGEENKYGKASVDRVVGALTRWAAALGSQPARDLLVELEAGGTLATGTPLPPAKFTDLPPWW